VCEKRKVSRLWPLKGIYVNPAYTSQTWSHCGHSEKANRKSQAEFLCVACGFTAHADLNAPERGGEYPPGSTTAARRGTPRGVAASPASDGTLRWSTPVKLLDGSEKMPTPVPHSVDPGFTGGYAVDMSPVASADTVYYSTPANRIYAIQSSDGKILAQFWVDKTTQTTVLSRLVLFVGP
jgi:Putative transposase DNA-binding domain